MSPRLARTATLAALVFALAGATAHAATPTAFVYATSWDAQGARQYAADAAGTLWPLTPPSEPTGNTSTGAAASPDGRSLYVVDQGSDSVSQYDIAVDGTLTPKTPARVATGASGPRRSASPSLLTAGMSTWPTRAPGPSPSSRSGQAVP